MMRKSNILFLVLFIIYLFAVAWCCFWRFDSMPDIGRTLLGIPTDKVVHFIMFFPFPILCFLAFDRHTDKPWKSVVAVSLTFATGCLVALGTEIGQSFTTYRMGDKTDFLSDMVAMAVSSIITLAIDLLKMKKEKSLS